MKYFNVTLYLFVMLGFLAVTPQKSQAQLIETATCFSLPVACAVIVVGVGAGAGVIYILSPEGQESIDRLSYRAQDGWDHIRTTTSGVNIFRWNMGRSYSHVSDNADAGFEQGESIGKNLGKHSEETGEEYPYIEDLIGRQGDLMDLRDALESEETDVLSDNVKNIVKELVEDLTLDAEANNATTIDELLEYIEVAEINLLDDLIEDLISEGFLLLPELMIVSPSGNMYDPNTLEQEELDGLATDFIDAAERLPPGNFLRQYFEDRGRELIQRGAKID